MDEVKDPSLVFNAINKGMESLGIGKESKFIPIFRTLDNRIMYWSSSYNMKDYNFDLNDDFMVKELMEGNLYLKNDKGEYRWILCRAGFAKIEK